MSLSTTVICPYCGHENKYTAESAWGRKLYNCFIGEGGCDGTFVVEHRAHLATAVKRVEGEEKYAADRANNSGEIDSALELLKNERMRDSADKEWTEIWEMIYAFQKTIPDELEVTEDNAKKLGLRTVRVGDNKLLFIDECLSNRLFLYRISH